jgi:hypothetical protein
MTLWKNVLIFIDVTVCCCNFTFETVKTHAIIYFTFIFLYKPDDGLLGPKHAVVLWKCLRKISG